MVEESKYYKATYDMQLIDEKLATQLDDTKVAKSPIQGIHWYSIVANPDYSDQFSYISINTPNRDELIVDDDANEDNDCEQSDMVQLILNLAFISDGFVQQLTFGPGISQQLKAINMGSKSVLGMLSGRLNQSRS